MAQVLAGTETGAEALNPGDVGLRVKDAPSGSDVEITPDKDKESKSKEGTSGNPIVVGEVASKHKIRKVLAAYRENS